MPKWWMPDNVALVGKLPLTATAKINKRELRSQFFSKSIDEWESADSEAMCRRP